MPRGEVLTRGPQHDHLDLAVLLGEPPCLIQLLEHLLALGIGRLGPVESDDPDVIVDLELHMVETHGASFAGRRCPSRRRSADEYRVLMV